MRTTSPATSEAAPSTAQPGRQTAPNRPLRALTYLAPGIPLEVFEIITDYLSRVLAREIELEVDSHNSGPMHGEPDPFAEDRADIGFLCSPSYLYLRAQPSPSVVLIPAGFVTSDPRAAGHPVYFSDVVVRADHRARSFADLAGSIWGFNDECSLSGYFSALQRLSEQGLDGAFFSSLVQTGSHHASIEATLAGDIDGAAIDATVLTAILRERPELAGRLRVLDSFGPFPVQPMVVRSALGPELAERIASALCGLQEAEDHMIQLNELGLQGFAPITESAFAEERRALCKLGELPEPSTDTSMP